MNCLMNTFAAIREKITQSRDLRRLVGKADCSIEIYGSSVNSLAQQADSDLDLTILIDNFEVNHELVLKLILNELSTSERFSCAQSPRQI